MSLIGQRWTADHVVPHVRGGASDIDNFLPTCATCNRLRWHYNARRLKKIIRLGVYLNKEIDKKTLLGRQVEKFYRARLKQNGGRRKNKKHMPTSSG
jgi:5-methylcytosine-specific restriction endonuclease McrA